MNEEVVRATYTAKALGWVEAALNAGMRLPLDDMRIRDERIAALLAEVERQAAIIRTLRDRLEESNRRVVDLEGRIEDLEGDAREAER